MIRALSIISTGLLATAWGATYTDFVGTWQDDTEGGYGGVFKVCLDSATGTGQGFYSDVGYTRGAIVEANGQVTWQGEWYEGGEFGFGENWGYFVLTLADDGQSFNGTWAAASDPTTESIWESTRVSAAAVSNEDCFATTIPASASASANVAATNAMALHGSWEVEGTPEWHICIDGSTFTSSYKYFPDGEETKGYISGDVLLGGRVLLGKWVEQGASGLYLINAQDSQHFFSSWWNVTELSAIDTAFIDNENMHGIEIPSRISSSVSSEKCAMYSCAATGCEDDSKSNGDDDDDDNEAAVVVALSVCLAFAVVTFAGVVRFLHKTQASRDSKKAVQLQEA